MDGTGDRTADRQRVERFAREHPSAVLYDGAGSLLLDVAAAKALPLDWSRVVSVDERRDRTTGRPYLVLVRDDGVQVALADAGIAFAPGTASTGPVPDLPDVVCLRDLASAEARLRHHLLDHPGEPVTGSHLALFLFCLAAVDGARAVGFDVGPEERRLERLLGEMEARRPSG